MELNIWDEITFATDVKNIGAVDAGEFTVGLYAGARLLEKRDFSGLERGYQQRVQFTWRAEAKPLVLDVVVDTENLVRESDESNNVSDPMSVLPTIPPYRLDEVTWSPERPELEDDTTFWAHVKNTATSASPTTRASPSTLTASITTGPP